MVGKKYKLKKLVNPPPHMTSKETCYCEVCVVGTKYLKINSTPSHAWPVRKKDGYTLCFFKRSSCSWCCIRPLNSSTHSHTWPTRKLKCELCEAGKKKKQHPLFVLYLSTEFFILSSSSGCLCPPLWSSVSKMSEMSQADSLICPCFTEEEGYAPSFFSFFSLF